MLLVRPSTPRFTAPGNGHHTIGYTPGDSSMRRDALGLVMGQEELRPRARLAYHSPQHHRPSATPNVRANGAAVGAAAVIALRVAWVASAGGPGCGTCSAHGSTRRREYGHIVGYTPGVSLDTGSLSSDDPGGGADHLLHSPHSSRLRWAHGASGDPLPAFWGTAERVVWRPLSEPDSRPRLRQPRRHTGSPHDRAERLGHAHRGSRGLWGPGHGRATP